MGGMMGLQVREKREGEVAGVKENEWRSKGK